MTVAHEAPRPRDLREAVRQALHLEELERWHDLAQLAGAVLAEAPPGHERDRVTLCIAAARARAKCGYVDDAAESLRAVRPALGALRDDDLAAEWHSAMSAVLYRQGDMHGAASEADDCLRLAHGGRRSAYLRGVACQTLALVARHGGDWAAARRLLHKAVDTFGQCGAETREARAQMNLCSVLVWAGEWDEFEIVVRDVLAAARRLDAPRLAKQAWVQMAMVARGRGQSERARECLDRARQVRAEGLDPREAALAREVEGDLCADAGAFAEAFAAYDDVVTQGRALGLGRDIVFEGLRKRAEAAWALGDIDRAASDAEVALAEARAHASALEIGASLRVLALVAASRGDEPGARVLAREAVETLARVRERFERARALIALAEHLADPAAARAEAATLARTLAARGLLAALRTGDLPTPRGTVVAEPRLAASHAATVTLAPPSISSPEMPRDGESPDRGALALPAPPLPLPACHVRDACVRHDMARVLAHGGDALLEGEPGTELVAIAAELHRRSARRGACVIVDLRATAPDRHAAVLFGADGEAGACECAAGGTLVLRDLVALAPATQAALAHALRTRRVRPHGGAGECAIDVTVYATAPLRLPVALAESVLARELAAVFQYNRLHVPALRHRPDDLAETLDRLWQGACARHGVRASFTAAARTALLHAPWEGNADEMARALDDLARTVAPDAAVRVADLDSRLAACALRPPVGGLAQQEHEFLVERVLSYLRAARFNYAQAARLAGYTRSGFLKLVVRLGLKDEGAEGVPATEPDTARTTLRAVSPPVQGLAAM